MKRLIPIFALLAAAGGLYYQFGPALREPPKGTAQYTDSVIERAFRTRMSDIQVHARGIVARVLKDDIEGGRHQRFIVRLTNGQTVLIAHNVDVAPRIPSVKEGDSVEFHGEYEWNSKGGVVHWTHHDPLGGHQRGWLKHDGKTYD